MRRGIAVPVVTLGLIAGSVPAVAVASSDAHATGSVAASQSSSTVTRWTTSPTTNVRASASTSSAVVGTLPRASQVTGTLTSGWVKVVTPAAFAGKYVSASVLSTTGPHIWHLYVAFAGVSTYASASTSAAKAPVAVGAPFDVVMTSGVWARIVGGPSGGRYVDAERMTTSNPAAPPSGASVPSNRAPSSAKVTRWVAAYAGAQNPVKVRAAATTHSAAVTELNGGTSVVGTYVNPSWFKIAAGANTGRYVSAGRLVASSNLAAWNGAMPKADLCALPARMQTGWEPTTPRYLDCSALAGLVEMNAAFKAKFGYDLTIDEGYRDRAKQDFFYALWGRNVAAIPGQSNHGFASAIDLDDSAGNPYVFGSAADAWLTLHGADYGWDRPAYLDEGCATSEYWHYNWVG